MGFPETNTEEREDESGQEEDVQGLISGVLCSDWFKNHNINYLMTVFTMFRLSGYQLGQVHPGRKLLCAL